MFIPLFGILKFIFYFGWLNVAETLINPFGEDDEDFDVNYLINRKIQLALIRSLITVSMNKIQRKRYHTIAQVYLPIVFVLIIVQW